ncbi:MAG: peptidase MA family metallohydrolase [Actinomycetota bacterium]
MRTIITFCGLCVVLLSAAQARSDTIVLKSGTRIVADSVREYNGQVEYSIGDNTLTIPKSIVARIERGTPGVAPVGSSEASAPASVSAEDLPQMRNDMEISDDLVARVIRNGQVDTDALRTIEIQSTPPQVASAYAIAAGVEENQNHLPVAAGYLESALHYLPENPILLENYASILLRLGRLSEAIPYAEQAARADSHSSVAFWILGYAYYKNDRDQEAIATLKKSLQLHADDKVRQLLERIERESRTEADFRQQESDHFTLHYEGSQANGALRQQILNALEQSYNKLESDLGASPRNIDVSLYTDQAFFDVTQAPAWSAALNDGKIRIPISGVTTVSPELAGVLRHELTHSFVAQITHGRAPQWLNEGIAELEQGASTSSFGAKLAAVYSSGHQVPLNMLEGNFESLDKSEALVAYAESLAAVEYIASTYGVSDVARILQRLGEGQSIETALRNTIHGGYKELDVQVTEYLKRTYGS